MEDVARRAGVALGTVSNVLNRPQKVSTKTSERVLRAIEELGFVPNRAARVLAAGSSSTIGFVVVDLSNSFFLDMTRGAQRQAASLSMNLLLANSDVDLEREREYLELFAEERVAGVLLAPVGSAPFDMASVKPLTLPTVLLNSEPTDEACTVSVDDELGGYLATQHLLASGRRRLMFAGDPSFAPPVGHRYSGARRAVEEVAGATLQLVSTAEVQAEDGREVGRGILEHSVGERPDGVVAASDLLALGILQSLLSGGVRIPRDIAVTGYDNNRSAWSSEIPITTLDQPGEEMGAVATRMLLDELREGAAHEHEHTVLKPRLIVRASSSDNWAAADFSPRGSAR